jgi:exoribonuclease R
MLPQVLNAEICSLLQD